MSRASQRNNPHLNYERFCVMIMQEEKRTRFVGTGLKNKNVKLKVTQKNTAI